MTKWQTTSPFLPTRGRKLALGLGLIGIGKPWGHINPTVPDENSAQTLLHTALGLGLCYFDTAPSYGVSEQRISRFLQEITRAERRKLIIATKFGEHWDAAASTPFVDHSFAALARSVETSLERLGSIDFLQLHKTTPEALRSKDVERAFAYAQSLGITNIGASVSDLESADIALNTGMFSVLQFPLNASNRQFGELGARATKKGLLVAINRPFVMGTLLYGDRPTTATDAFRFLVAQPLDGVVLTGTKSARHLEENWKAFQDALVADQDDKRDGQAFQGTDR